MAEKSLWFRMFGEDRVTPVFKKVGAEAEITAAKVRGSFAEAGAMIGGPIGKGTAEANRGMKAMGHGAMMTAGVMVGAVGAIAYHTTKMAGDFQSAIVRLETTAGESKQNLDTVSQGILDMASRVGYSAQDLAVGMYTVESAGYHGAAGLKVMEAAAKGARVEGADLTTVTDAVSSLLVDYHLKASDAAKVTNVLTAAVGHGKTTFEGMAAALPNVAAAGATAHISMSELASAIATMTMHGTDASVAGTYLRQVIGQLEAPSAKAQKTMAGLGVNANQLALTLSSGSGHGLADAIEMIDTAIAKHLTPSGLVAVKTFQKSKGSAQDFHKMLKQLPPTMTSSFGALAHMTGGVKSLQGFLQLGGENLKTYRSNVAAVNEQVRKGGKDVQGFSEYQKTYNGEVADAKAAVSALGVGIGTDLLPYVTKLASGLATGVTWMTKHKKITELAIVTIGALGVAIGVVTVATAAWNAVMDANPISLVVIALAGLAAGLVYAYNHFEWFHHGVVVVWTWIKDHWKLLVPILLTTFFGPIGLLIGVVITHFGAFKKAGEEAFNGIETAAKWMWNNVLMPVFKSLVGAIAWVMNKWGDMLDALSHVPGFGWAKGAADAMHAAARQAQGLADALGRIPDHKSVTVSTNYVQLNHGQPDTLPSWLQPGNTGANALPGLLNPSGVVTPKGGSHRHNALGTSNWRGGWTEVGETGPEDVYLPPGAQVLSHAKTVAANTARAVAAPINGQAAAGLTVTKAQTVRLRIGEREFTAYVEDIADDLYTSRQAYAQTTGHGRGR